MSVYWKAKPPTIPLGFLCWRCWFDPTAKCNNSLRIQRRIHSCTYQCPSGFFLSIKENKLNKRNITDLKRPFHVKNGQKKVTRWVINTFCLAKKPTSLFDWKNTQSPAVNGNPLFEVKQTSGKTATTAEVGFSDLWNVSKKWATLMTFEQDKQYICSITT